MIDAYRITLSSQDDFHGWREAARWLAEAGVSAEAIIWQIEGGEPDLFGEAAPLASAPSFAVPAPSLILQAVPTAIPTPNVLPCSMRCSARLRANHRATEGRADPLLDRLQRMAKEVRRAEQARFVADLIRNRDLAAALTA